MPIRSAALIFSTLSLLACGSLRVIDIPSNNQNSRVNHLVIHFTSEDFTTSLEALTKPSSRPVSAHYLVPHTLDPTYSHASVRVYRLVEEHNRAWHAGKSQWFREQSLNDRSIGIELVNRSSCGPDQTESGQLYPLAEVCQFKPYPEAQIQALIKLMSDIVSRHPEITPLNIVGHADIAPDRKVDPGPLFPWQRLYEAGFGAWYLEHDLQFYRDLVERKPLSIAAAQAALLRIGYPIELSGVEDATSQRVVRAFQMRYRPKAYSGILDSETIAIALALLNRYRPMLLSEIAVPTHTN